MSWTKNKFFKNKNINPKNFWFYENTSDNNRAKSETQPTTNKPKYVIESYEDVCSQYVT